MDGTDIASGAERRDAQARLPRLIRRLVLATISNGIDAPSCWPTLAPFILRATDAATNSAVATQSFTLDTAAPGAPELTASVPATPANDNSPKLIGSAPAESTVRLYTTNDCSGSAIATATAAELAAGVTVAVPDDSLTRFRATSTSPAGNPTSCSAALTYREDSTAPQTQVDSGPPTQSNSAAASLSFSGTDTGGSGVASFQCRIDSTQTSDWTTCNSP